LSHSLSVHPLRQTRDQPQTNLSIFAATAPAIFISFRLGEALVEAKALR
jgi:hypothetical protein